jgi:hypothetical protein
VLLVRESACVSEWQALIAAAAAAAKKVVAFFFVFFATPQASKEAIAGFMEERGWD